MTMRSRDHSKKLGVALVAVAIALATLAAPSSAKTKGHVEQEIGVGYFYSTFDQSPNTQLIVGGAAEEFCESSPDDPFNGEPGTTTARIFERRNGSVDIRVFDKTQPIFLYETVLSEAPLWIAQVCDDYIESGVAPEPLAIGTGILRAHIAIGTDGVVDVFNAVHGWANGPDGTRYKVDASADLVVVGGDPVGNPEDFVSLRLKVFPPR